MMDTKARYRAKNREKLRAKDAVYRAANREKIRLASLSYQRKNAIYYTYYSMLVRCYNPENNGYHNYGGRGIQVCDEWRQSRDAFKNWAIANGWERGLQIDRIDNDGDYEPGNCMFTTGIWNSRKRRTSRLVLDDVLKIKAFLAQGASGSELARKFGVSPQTICDINKGRIWRGV